MRLVLFIAAFAFAGDVVPTPVPLSPSDTNKILQAENAVLKFRNAAHEETARYQREIVRLGQMEQQARKEYYAAVAATRPKDCEGCQFDAGAMTWTPKAAAPTSGQPTTPPVPLAATPPAPVVP